MTDSKVTVTYDADHLPLGIYRIHWVSGGSSLAAVGMGSSGLRWVAPINWIAPVINSCELWKDIERMELLAWSHE